MKLSLMPLNHNKNELKINSFLFSFLISINILAAIFSAFNIITYGFSIYSILLIYILFFINSFQLFTRKINERILYIFILLLFIILSFLISLARLEFSVSTVEIIKNFLLFGLIGIIIGSVEIDTELVLRYLSYISILITATIDTLIDIYSIGSSSYLRLEMGLSYAIMPVILGSFFHMFFYYKQSNLVLKISYILNIYLSYIFIIHGTRGAIISYLLFFIIVVSSKVINNGVKIDLKKMLFFIFFLMMIIIFSRSILEITSNILNKYGIYVSFIEKSRDLLSTEGNIFNQRIGIYSVAWNGFLKSPIFGNGIGSFKFYTGEVYVHNIFLEILYELGFFVFVPVLAIFINLSYITFIRGFKNKDMYILLSFLYLNSIPRLMFSASFWSLQIFWMLIGYYFVNFLNIIGKEKL